VRIGREHVLLALIFGTGEKADPAAWQAEKAFGRPADIGVCHELLEANFVDCLRVDECNRFGARRPKTEQIQRAACAVVGAKRNRLEDAVIVWIGIESGEGRGVRNAVRIE
jgi:hypothetical protein